MQRLGGSSCNLAETQRPRLALEGARQTNPSFRTKRKREGHIKKPGEPLIDLPAEAKGLSLQLYRDPATQVRTRGASANKPLLPNRKVARGSYKKPGEPLTALSLCVEAKGLFLQICQDPATQARTRGGLGKQTLMREGRLKSQGNS